MSAETKDNSRKCSATDQSWIITLREADTDTELLSPSQPPGARIGLMKFISVGTEIVCLVVPGCLADCSPKLK